MSSGPDVPPSPRTDEDFAALPILDLSAACSNPNCWAPRPHYHAAVPDPEHPGNAITATIPIGPATALTDDELELLHDAISAWIADYLVRVSPKLGSHSLNDARAVGRLEAMVDLANKLGMNL